MAKILFISVNDVVAGGLRGLSACLKQKGHESYIIFLQKNGFPYTASEKYLRASKDIKRYDWVGVDERLELFRYSRGPDITAKETDILLSLIRDIKPDLIGFSIVTPLRRKNAGISRSVREKFDIPIIWGGHDPTMDPKNCLRYCDYVCVGEGEKVIVDIARCIDNGSDIKKTNNVAYLKKGQLVRNPLYPLMDRLDTIPFKDIYPRGKFLIEDDAVVRDFDEIGYRGRHLYNIMSSRGCCFDCSYCEESMYRRLYTREKLLRRRSPSNVIKELREAKKTAGFEVVMFEDEIFSLDYRWLECFCDLYKKSIGLPFICNVYPHKNLEKQLKVLKKAGLAQVCLGLQSGSERINREIFTRPFDRALFLKTARKLKSMGIYYYVDIITYNPFEREEDLRATLSILKQLPKPFNICVNKLYPLKGTKIYDSLRGLKRNRANRAVSDKIFGFYTRMFFSTMK